MPFLSQAEAFEKFKLYGRNSSHFVCHLAGLKFYESQNGWVFGYCQMGDVTLLALEPLIPGAPKEYSDEDKQAFNVAWKEFLAETKSKIAVFVSVYSPFNELLKSFGFQSIKVGQEPWVDLSDCIPKGNAGKGVRSARNQALNAGLSVEEWKSSEIEADSSKKHVIGEIFKIWKGSRPLDLSGFMNSSDPFAHMDSRKYYILKSPTGRVEAYLVATPVPGIQSYFLEDMVIRGDAPRGAGELLTLEAMVALAETGAKSASLGVISMTTVDSDAAHQLPSLIQFFMLKVPKYLKFLYNFDGLETFRKRFRPHLWENIHLAVKNYPESKVSDTRAWFKALTALLISFRPKLQLSWGWLFESITRPVQRYPLTFIYASVSIWLFASINKFGKLPATALSRFGFSGNAPIKEWFFRSIVSDFLYFDATHFALWGSAFFLTIFWCEKTHKRKFILPYLLFITVFDDFINYALVIKPFSYIQPVLFKNLVAVKDVGGSLGLVALCGLQLCQFRKAREILFAVCGLGLVFGFTFQAMQLQNLVLNLNHFLFLCIGFTSGKLKFEWERHRSRLASKGKAPVAKCVAIRQPLQNAASEKVVVKKAS